MFSISTQVRYSLRALLFIAVQEGSAPVPLTLIAEKEDISKKYLENIFTLLKRGGLVTSSRGPVGGYTLAVSPEKVRLYDIVLAVDGRPRVVDCISDPDVCGKYRSCSTREVWDDMQKEIEGFLKNRTLTSILSERSNLNV